MSTSPIRVLLIEDDEDDAVFVHHRLAQASGARAGEQPYRVTWMRTLEDGLRSAASSAVDVILLDLHLPGSTGHDSVHRVRQNVPGAPIVVLTGIADDDCAVWAVRHGAQDYLVKGSTDTRQLDRSIRFAIERFRMLAKLGEYANSASELEGQLRYLISANPGGIAVVDEGARLVFSNPAANRLLGPAGVHRGARFPWDFAVGRTLALLLPDARGGCFHIDMTACHMSWDGLPATVVFLQDRTAAHRVAELEARLEAIEALGTLRARRTATA